MSFNFGNTSQTPFGSTPAKPSGFGAPLSFGTPASAAAPTFGSGGFGASTFGTPVATAAAQPTASFGFSTPAVSKPPPAFGTTFGTPVNTAAAPAFGTSFGQPAANTTGAFGSFGTQQQQQQQQQSTGLGFGSTFGTPASSAPAFGSTFGSPATSTNQPFGARLGTGTTSLFGSGGGLTSATSKPSLFGTPNTGSSLFGTATSGAPSLFGSGGGLSTGGGLFGSSGTTQTPSLFGTGTTGTFGTGSGGLFGASGGSTLFGGGGGGAFGTQQQPQQAAFGAAAAQRPAALVGVPNGLLEVLQSFCSIRIFNDERDEVLKKWNLLQASWGTGKGYYNPTQPPIEYNDCNPYYVFRGIGYFMVPSTDNSEGLVKLIFNKKESELRTQKDALTNGIAGILGNKPNLTIVVKSIKSISENETEIMISVYEKSVTGTSRTILASDLAMFLNQPTQKQQLTNVGVSCISPCLMPSKAQIEEYLKCPPPGFEKQMWQAAQADNPQPNKFLPMPMNGFANLKKRMISEEYETGLHRSFLENVNREITELKRKHTATLSQIAEQKQKFIQLQHRVLQILVKQEVTRKVGMALQPEEEVIRGRLEMMHAHLNVPSQFRGQINELVSCVKFSDSLDNSRNESYKIDPKVQEDVKQFLKMQQNGIAHLVQIINTDLKDLKTIFEGMNQIIKK